MVIGVGVDLGWPVTKMTETISQMTWVHKYFWSNNLLILNFDVHLLITPSLKRIKCVPSVSYPVTVLYKNFEFFISMQAMIKEQS